MTSSPLQGGCACGAVRYQLDAAPLVIHCCHCTWCQRETGSAFAINIVLETDHLTTMAPPSATSAVLERIPSASGKGQSVARCPTCHVALWSHYGSAGPLLSFVRAGTLDDGPLAAGQPDVFLYTRSKVSWVTLPARGTKAFEEDYEEPEGVWSQQSLRRLEALKPRVEEWRASQAQGN